MLIDIHTHTYPTSDDSALTPEELIAQSKKIGLDGICLTAHAGFWDPRDVEKLGKDNDYLVIPGCEVTTEEGHLLVYGLSEYIFGMHKSSFVHELVKEAGGAIVVAHPYRRVYRETAPQDPKSYDEMLARALRNRVFGMVDGVEVRNGRGSEQENKFSERLSKKLDMSGTGASDAHKLADIGTFATRFEEKITGLSDLIRCIKSGKFSAERVRPILNSGTV